jgi:hypothetical protein
MVADRRHQLWLEAEALVDRPLIQMSSQRISELRYNRLRRIYRRAEARVLRRIWKLIID